MAFIGKVGGYLEVFEKEKREKEGCCIEVVVRDLN